MKKELVIRPTRVAPAMEVITCDQERTAVTKPTGICGGD